MLTATNPCPEVFEVIDYFDVAAIKCLYVIILILVKEHTLGLAEIHMKSHLKGSFFNFIQKYLSLF